MRLTSCSASDLPVRWISTSCCRPSCLSFRLEMSRSRPLLVLWYLQGNASRGQVQISHQRDCCSAEFKPASPYPKHLPACLCSEYASRPRHLLVALPLNCRILYVPHLSSSPSISLICSFMSAISCSRGSICFFSSLIL